MHNCLKIALKPVIVFQWVKHLFSFGEKNASKCTWEEVEWRAWPLMPDFPGHVQPTVTSHVILAQPCHCSVAWFLICEMGELRACLIGIVTGGSMTVKHFSLWLAQCYSFYLEFHRHLVKGEEHWGSRRGGKWKLLSHVWLCATNGLYRPWNSPGQNTGVGKLFPSPGDLRRGGE